MNILDYLSLLVFLAQCFSTLRPQAVGTARSSGSGKFRMTHMCQNGDADVMFALFLTTPHLRVRSFSLCHLAHKLQVMQVSKHLQRPPQVRIMSSLNFVLYAVNDFWLPFAPSPVLLLACANALPNWLLHCATLVSKDFHRFVFCGSDQLRHGRILRSSCPCIVDLL